MLRQLAQYANDHDLSPEPGFAPKPALWAIDIGPDGAFIDIIPLGDTSAKGNRGEVFPKAPELTQPELKAGGIYKSHFLIDTADVVALHVKDEPDAKTTAKHLYFIDLLTKAAKAVPELDLAAQCLADEQSLERIRRRLTAARAKPSDKVTLRINGRLPARSDEWRDWWRAFRATIGGAGSKSASAPLMRCMISGELVEPAPTHPKIQGLTDVDGSSMGSVLVGFDKDAFASYGLSQSANAAVGELPAAAYRAALNDIIDKHSRRLAGAKVAHWYKQAVPIEADPLSFLSGTWDRSGVDEIDAQRRARELLEAIAAGQRPDLANNHYYALTLSGASGRVMVRDWMEGPFEQLVRHVLAWFDDLAIVRRDGSGLAPPPKFMAVLGATVRDLDDLAAPMVTKLWRVAIGKEPLPQAALNQAVLRFRVDVIEDSPLNHARMGLIRMYHRRKGGGDNMSQAATPYLNEDHPSPAYHCGRLVAILAGLQRAALGDVGAGVVQRYYASASATPALVLGRMSTTAQFHLGKLRGEGKKGTYMFYQDRIAGVWSKLREDHLPRTLNLEEQSLFAMGYYHQLADLRTKKADPDSTDTSELGAEQSADRTAEDPD